MTLQGPLSPTEGQRSESGASQPTTSGPSSEPCASPETHESHVRDTQTSVDSECSQQAQKVCTTCGATETPMWRNGAEGPKTLCNACGVKYQRRMHKEKVAADAAAAAAAAAVAAAAEASEGSSRLQRTASGALRQLPGDGPPGLTRRSCSRTAGTSDSGPPRQNERPARVITPLEAALPGPPARRPSSAADGKRRVRRAPKDDASRRHTSPQQIASHGVQRATGASTAPASTATTFTPGAVTRLDGLQMQMAGRGGMPITIPQVTVLLQPVTRAQALWSANASTKPSVALCAYDSSGSFLAAAPSMPEAAIAWTFPTSQSAAWHSGFGWALIFVQQQQHEAFRALLMEWQAAQKARQTQSTSGNHSTDDSGASADTSRPYQGLSVRQSRSHQKRSAAKATSRKRTVNCIRAVSDADALGALQSVARSAPVGGAEYLLAASSKRSCSGSVRGSYLGLAAQQPAMMSPAASAPSEQQGLQGVAEGCDGLSAVEMEMAHAIGSSDTPGSGLLSQASLGGDRSVCGGSAFGFNSSYDCSYRGSMPHFVGSPAVSAPINSQGFAAASHAFSSSQGLARAPSASVPFAMSMGGGECWGAPPPVVGSLGADSDVSAGTGYTQLSRRFGSMHVASSDSLSDMAFSRGRASFGDSSHGRSNRSSQSADTEARVRAGQLSYGTSFASMAPPAQPVKAAAKVLQGRTLHSRPCSLLEEFDIELDPLDPRFLAQVTAPSEAAVRGGSAAQALLQGDHPMNVSPSAGLPASAPVSASLAIEPPCSAGELRQEVGSLQGFVNSQATTYDTEQQRPQQKAQQAPQITTFGFTVHPPPLPEFSQPDSKHFQFVNACEQAPPHLLGSGFGGSDYSGSQQPSASPSPAPSQRDGIADMDAPKPPLAPVPLPHNTFDYPMQDSPPEDMALTDILCEFLLDAETGPAMSAPTTSALAAADAAPSWERTVQRAAAAIQHDAHAPWPSPPPRTPIAADLLSQSLPNEQLGHVFG